jgi:hypothetical protein
VTDNGIKLNRYQMLSLLLEQAYWFTAGYLVATHDWHGAAYAVALRVPLSVARRIMAEVYKMRGQR